MIEPSDRTEAANQRIDDMMWLEAEDILSTTLHRQRAPAVTVEALKDRLVQVYNHNIPKRIRPGVHIKNRGRQEA